MPSSGSTVSSTTFVRDATSPSRSSRHCGPRCTTRPSPSCTGSAPMAKPPGCAGTEHPPRAQTASPSTSLWPGGSSAASATTRRPLGRAYCGKHCAACTSRSSSPAPGSRCVRRWPRRKPPGHAWSKPQTRSAAAGTRPARRRPAAPGGDRDVTAVGPGERRPSRSDAGRARVGGAGPAGRRWLSCAPWPAAFAHAALDEGLPAAIRGLVSTSPVPVDAQVTGEPVPERLATTAYYVAAEALTNALKHAEAGSVAIEVALDEGELVVRVCDDGRGGANDLGRIRSRRPG